ncbi:MAG: flagellar hook-length control protein FliK [Candidatus Saganbacteria bacterium]|nr:flagellar hook-length control protein FliK [Candidatus Saganbacteria bacterium]
MTVQFTQIPATEPRLLPDTRVQTASENSFQNYLDTEQKRLALMFCPFGQLDLSTWWSSLMASAENGTQSSGIRLFSDLEPAARPNDTAEQNTLSRGEGQNVQPVNSFEEFTGLLFGRQDQPALQDLLQQTGWLTPNLEAQPQMFLAQTQGKFLARLDLQALVDEIISQVKLVKGKGQVELSLGLKPRELGDILLTLTSRSGMIAIQIEAPEETRKLLQDRLAELETALKKARVNLSGISLVSSKEVKDHA